MQDTVCPFHVSSLLASDGLIILSLCKVIFFYSPVCMAAISNSLVYIFTIKWAIWVETEILLYPISGSHGRELDWPKLGWVLTSNSAHQCLVQPYECVSAFPENRIQLSKSGREKNSEQITFPITTPNEMSLLQKYLCNLGDERMKWYEFTSWTWSSQKDIYLHEISQLFLHFWKYDVFIKYAKYYPENNIHQIVLQ